MLQMSYSWGFSILNCSLLKFTQTEIIFKPVHSTCSEQNQMLPQHQQN